MNKTIGTVIIMTMGSALVAGCGFTGTSSQQAAGSHSSSTPKNTAIPSSTTGTSAAPSSTASPSASPSNTSSSSTSTNSSTPTASTVPSPAVNSSTTGAGIQLVKEWMQSGFQGEGLNMPIGDGKTIEVVQKQWGNGKDSSAGAGLYVTYAAQRVAFGVGPGDQIFDVRSDAANIQQVTRADVTSALGAPAAIRYADNTTIYMYPDGPNYQVLWTFSGGPGHTGNTVDHVSVYWPQGTVNLMGQTLPNPSVVVTQNSASAGSYIQFSIKDAPAGFRLDELEWLPSSQGTTVVNTNAQALYNGDHGIAGAVFMHTDGAYRLQFTSAMKGTSGQIRLIYEAPNGSAIIGTSNTITLQ